MRLVILSILCVSVALLHFRDKIVPQFSPTRQWLPRNGSSTVASLSVADVEDVAIAPTEALPSTGEVLGSVARPFTQGNGSVEQQLRSFEDSCVAAFPHLFTPERRGKQFLFSPMDEKFVIYEPRVVCVTRNVNIYRYESDNEFLKDRPFRSILREKPHHEERVDYQRRRAAFIGHRARLYGELGSELRLGAVQWHLSIALIMAARLDAHAYHFLMDTAMQALSLLRNDVELNSSTYEPVRVSDAVLNYIRKDDADRPMWPVGVSMVRALLSNLRTTDTDFANFTTRGSADNKTHCYCQGVLLHGTYRADRFKYDEPEYCFRYWNDYGCQVVEALRLKLRERFGLVPFGTLPPPESYQKYGLWIGATSTRRPRLLVGVRHDRRLANQSEIVAAAVKIGFDVQTITFEAHPPEVQFAAMRSADVFLGIHGASFTWIMFLDTLRPYEFCRSAVELLTSLPKKFWNFYVQESIMSNVRLYQVPHLDVEFHVSARERAHIARIAKKKPFIVMLRKQTLSYNLTAVYEALQAAYRNFLTCMANREQRT